MPVHFQPLQLSWLYFSLNFFIGNDFYVNMDIHEESSMIAKLGNISVCRLVTSFEYGESLNFVTI